MVRMWLLGLWALTALVAMPAIAQDRAEVLRKAEIGMVVTGFVEIEPDGSVSSHEITGRGELPDYVVAMVDEAAATWRFEPIEQDGVPVRARTQMSLRLVAQALGEGEEFVVRIDNGSFGGYDPEDTGRVVAKRMTPPQYPLEMLTRMAEGTVYLLVKVGRDGRVQDLAVERVNLGQYAAEGEMEQRRRALARSVEKTARRWVFRPPTTGPYVDRDWWVTRVPVEFEIDTPRRPRAGQWMAYIPGPALPVPEWGAHSSGSDAALAGVAQMLESEVKLLSPLHTPHHQPDTPR